MPLADELLRVPPTNPLVDAVRNEGAHLLDAPESRRRRSSERRLRFGLGDEKDALRRHDRNDQARVRALNQRRVDAPARARPMGVAVAADRNR